MEKKKYMVVLGLPIKNYYYGNFWYISPHLDQHNHMYYRS